MQPEKFKEVSSIKRKDIWQGLTLTNSAAYQIKQLIKDDPVMCGLRIDVKRSGCAGRSYSVEKATRFEKDEQVYEFNGAKICVPFTAMPFIDGTELDYVQEGLNYIFKFNNPKAQHICGCGASFSFE